MFAAPTGLSSLTRYCRNMTQPFFFLLTLFDRRSLVADLGWKSVHLMNQITENECEPLWLRAHFATFFK